MTKPSAKEHQWKVMNFQVGINGKIIHARFVFFKSYRFFLLFFRSFSLSFYFECSYTFLQPLNITSLLKPIIFFLRIALICFPLNASQYINMWLHDDTTGILRIHSQHNKSFMRNFNHRIDILCAFDSDVHKQNECKQKMKREASLGENDR